MEAEEIRDGVWLLDGENRPWLINKNQLLSREFWDFVEIGEVKPIKLTEEWLLKLGFKKFKGNIILEIKPRITLIYFDENINHFSLIQDGKELALSYSRVKHVHQLQNLYFALTNEELKFS